MLDGIVSQDMVELLMTVKAGSLPYSEYNVVVVVVVAIVVVVIVASAAVDIVVYLSQTIAECCVPIAWNALLSRWRADEQPTASSFGKEESSEE